MEKIQREESETKWRKDALPDRVLAATNGSQWRVLEIIGASVTSVSEEGGLDIEEFLPQLDPGIWVVELKFYGGSDIIDARVLSSRVATDEEVAAERNHEWPWDPGLWME